MKLLILLLALTSTSVLAETFDFKCTGTDLVYINSFEMDGTVDTELNTLTYSSETRTAGYEGETSESESMERDITIVDLTDLGESLGTRVYSVDKEENHVYINILLDYPGQLNSSIRDASGMLFKSTCKSL